MALPVAELAAAWLAPPVAEGEPEDEAGAVGEKECSGDAVALAEGAPLPVPEAQKVRAEDAVRTDEAEPLSVGEAELGALADARADALGAPLALAPPLRLPEVEGEGERPPLVVPEAQGVAEGVLPPLPEGCAEGEGAPEAEAHAEELPVAVEERNPV